MFLLVTMKLNTSSGLLLVLEWEISEKFFGEMGMPLVLDWVSCMFVMSVFYISGCVSLFSGFYMSHEVFMGRFTHLMQAFVFSMVILILFPGYLGLMVGWDGLGVVSFLLVVYYMNSESLSAGMITAISNRVGDACFILVIGMMSGYLSYNYSGGEVFKVGLVSVLILVGSMTKSAQIPFSAWLPEAMAAPTPVSTLVHSSTLVTAGVYVLVRFSEYLGELEMNVLMFISMVTMLLAASSGTLEVDMKKVVALSTLSQVGMMMFAISLGSNEVAFFHLLVHAFFKALMFMCVGGVIFYSSGCQDGRFLGGVWLKLPITSVLLVFSNLSLMGFPFLSGFYSKELIVGKCLCESYSLVGFLLVLVSLGFTVCYSSRMMMLMLCDVGASALSHYKTENILYMSALVMMSNGALSMAVLMQSYFSVFLSDCLPRGGIFYSFLVWVLFSLTNFIIILVVAPQNIISKPLKSTLSFMWFLKPMSGNFISSQFLNFMSYFISDVEMGWIRGYIWQSGMKNLVIGTSNKLRKMNFNMIGMIIFYCLVFVGLIFY
uniref:NADH:ubiquinone reductase (H(+)-translocating) n=1 Tax=Ruditapes decussatus TaxID=104385 RepID=A0A219LUV8_9BIVA|nr:NADH dehydrogenase subunit 5 [Ruditapes decussatus]AJY78596.1 NADH dehydrogenase subunit 5 [Ruditapes decussatus]